MPEPPAGATPQRDIFISYARSESAGVATALRDALDARLGPGRTYFDARDAPPDEHFDLDILEAMLASRVVVVFPSSTYFDKWWCRREYDLALAPYHRGKHASQTELEASLRHVIVAWTPGLPPAVSEHLPPPLVTLNAEPADRAEAIASRIEARLRTDPPTLGQRLADVSWLLQARDDFTADRGVPPPRSLSGTAHYARLLEESLGPSFVGRAQELSRIHNTLVPPSGVAQARANIWALAGSGKSRLAWEYLHRYGPTHYPGGLFWINADCSDSELEEQHYGIALSLGGTTRSLDELREMKANVAELLARTFEKTLKGRTLVVLDNVPEPEAGRPASSLSTLVPGSERVTVLATSRHRMVSFTGAWREVPLDTLGPEEAVRLLRRGLSDDIRERLIDPQWLEIAEWTGQLPIALDLLNKTLVSGTLSSAGLLELIRKDDEVQALDEQVQGLRDNGYSELQARAVGAAFRISFERLSKPAQRAACMVAWFAPAIVPEVLLGSAVLRAGGASGAGGLRGSLISRSFLTGGESGWRMHRLLGTFLRREGDAAKEWLAAAETLGSLLTDANCRDHRRRAEHTACIGAARNLAARRPPPSTPEIADRFGGLLHDLGSALDQLGGISADSAALVEAMAAYRSALEVCTRDRVPLDWARTQNNLGNVLLMLGEREDGTARLEEAATAYRAALEIHGRENFERRWALTLQNLGIALLRLGERERGTSRLEEAMNAFQSALKVRTRESDPLGWACTQDNLGNLLQQLGSREQKATRLEEAVAAYQNALKERTRTLSPLDWAQTQHNLGGVLQRLGTRENGTPRLKQAVAAYHAALEVRTRERVPLHWAETQDNLGGVLRVLGRREKQPALLAEAVAAFRSALEVRTRERVPLAWASTQGNLGNVLQAQAEHEEGAERLEQAVAAYQSALSVYARDLQPLDWARTHYNLGNACLALGQREGATGWLEQAIEAYRSALEVHSRDLLPLDWAKTQNNLGVALQVLGQREKGKARLEEALMAFRLAYEVFERSEPGRAEQLRVMIAHMQRLIAAHRLRI